MAVLHARYGDRGVLDQELFCNAFFPLVHLALVSPFVGPAQPSAGSGVVGGFGRVSLDSIGIAGGFLLARLQQRHFFAQHAA